MKNWKKMMSLLLALVMVLSMFCTSALAEETKAPFVNTFKDTQKGQVDSWVFKAVNYVQENKLMDGMSKTTFAPTVPVSRAMAVTVLHRLAGKPSAEGAAKFTDVPAGWYSNAVAWASQEGIAKGVGGKRFSPETNVTRQDLMVMFYRYMKALDLSTTARAELSGYKDGGDIASYARNAVSWAVEVGLMKGVGGKRLAPTDVVTRAQLAAFLQRLKSTVIPGAETDVGDEETPTIENPFDPSGPIGPVGPVHTHTSDGIWHSSRYQHWNECTADGVAMNLSSHTPAGDYCSVCGRLLTAQPTTPAPENDPITSAIEASVTQVNNLSKPYFSAGSDEIGNVEIKLTAASDGRNADLMAEATAETADGLTDSVLAVAAIYAYRILGLELPADESAAVEELKPIVKDILTEMGIDWNEKSKTQLVKDIVKAILADGKGEAKNIWANFHDESGYLFDTAVVSCGGTDIVTVATTGGKVTVNGGRSLDTISGKKLAVKTIAKALLDSVKRSNPSETDTVKAAAELTVKYTGERATVNGQNPDSILNCGMSVKSSLFTYGYVGGAHNVTVNLPGVKNWIGQTMADKVADALTNENTMKAIVSKVQGESMNVTQNVRANGADVSVTASPKLEDLAVGKTIPLTVNSMVMGGVTLNTTEVSAALTINAINAGGVTYQSASDLLIAEAKGLLDGTVDPQISVTATINGSATMNGITIGFNNTTQSATMNVGANISAALQGKKNSAELKDSLKAYCESSGDKALKLAARVDAALDYAIECALGTPTDAQRDAAVNGILSYCTVGEVLEIAKGTRYADKVQKVEDLVNRLADNISIDGKTSIKEVSVSDLQGSGVTGTLTYHSYTENVVFKLNLD